MKSVSLLAIALISMFLVSQAFAFCNLDKLVSKEKEKLSFAEDVKVGAKLKEYGTLVTYTYTGRTNIGGETVKYQMSGYSKYNENCKSFEGDGVVIY